MSHRYMYWTAYLRALARELATRREAAQDLVEWALLIVVFVVVAAIGLTPLGTAIASVFTELANKFKPGLPPGLT